VTPAAVLVAHGSRDPAAAATIRALGRAVAAARPGLDVRTAYLDHCLPRPDQVLAALAGAGRTAAVVVPLLLTHAFHGRVDLPTVLAGAPGPPARVTDVLGPVAGQVPPQLVAALRRRLRAAQTAGVRIGAGAASGAAAGRAVRLDAVVLAAAGTRDAAARRTVAQAARALGASLGLPCRVGYASAAGPTPGEVTALLRRQGAQRVAVAAYFVAPGRLYRLAADSARDAGAVTVAAPLGAAPELADLVVARIDGALRDETRSDGRGAGQQKGPGVEISGARPLAC
jgi:sirohydrochlorin ferrochelatase